MAGLPLEAGGPANQLVPSSFDFFGGGGNYQSLINEALRVRINMEEGRLEATLPKVIREELAALRSYLTKEQQ
jgi:hypothetical protein